MDLEISHESVFEMGDWLEYTCELDPNAKRTTDVELDCLAQIMSVDRDVMRQRVYGDLSDFADGEYTMTWEEVFGFPTCDRKLEEPDAWLDEVMRAAIEKTNVPEYLQKYDEFIPDEYTPLDTLKLLAKMKELGIAPDTVAERVRILRFHLFSLGIWGGLVVTTGEHPVVLSWDYYQHD